MANNNPTGVWKQQSFQNTSQATLDTAVNLAANGLAGNTIGYVDTSGTPAGTQTVIPNTIQIIPGAPLYDGKNEVNIFTSAIIWQEITMVA